MTSAILIMKEVDMWLWIVISISAFNQNILTHMVFFIKAYVVGTLLNCIDLLL